LQLAGDKVKWRWMTLELGAWWKKLDVMTKKRATLGKRRLDRLGLAAHLVVECSLPEEKERQADSWTTKNCLCMCRLLHLGACVFAGDSDRSEPGTYIDEGNKGCP
jgi:hypothetical protein